MNFLPQAKRRPSLPVSGATALRSRRYHVGREPVEPQRRERDAYFFFSELREKRRDERVIPRLRRDEPRLRNVEARGYIVDGLFHRLELPETHTPEALRKGAVRAGARASALKLEQQGFAEGSARRRPDAVHRVRAVERKLARYAQIIFFEPLARVQRRDENRRKLRELAPQLRAAAAAVTAQKVRNAAHDVHAVAEHDEVADA